MATTNEPLRDSGRIMIGRDWVRYTSHADNPGKVWRVREEFSLYGGRCVSYRDLVDCADAEEAGIAIARFAAEAVKRRK